MYILKWVNDARVHVLLLHQLPYVGLSEIFVQTVEVNVTQKDYI
jgi:hypothetical protein